MAKQKFDMFLEKFWAWAHALVQIGKKVLIRISGLYEYSTIKNLILKNDFDNFLEISAKCNGISSILNSERFYLTGVQH